MSSPTSLAPAFARYRIVSPLFSFLGRTYRVLNADGTLLLHVEHPLFRLLDEFILYADETRLEPLLVLKWRFTLGDRHDIFLAQGGALLGSVRARVLRSVFRDTWDVLGPDEQLAGELREDSLSALRRLVPFLTARHTLSLGGVAVAQLTQVRRIFGREFELDVLLTEDRVDPRFAVACMLVALMADRRRA